MLQWSSGQPRQTMAITLPGPHLPPHCRGSCHQPVPGPGHAYLYRISRSRYYLDIMCSAGPSLLGKVATAVDKPSCRNSNSSNNTCDTSLCDPVSKSIINFQDNSDVPSANKTSNNSVTHFFEGVEKNLEVWFTNTRNGRTSAESDLRNIPR